MRYSRLSKAYAASWVCICTAVIFCCTAYGASGMLWRAQFFKLCLSTMVLALNLESQVKLMNDLCHFPVVNTRHILSTLFFVHFFSVNPFRQDFLLWMACKLVSAICLCWCHRFSCIPCSFVCFKHFTCREGSHLFLWKHFRLIRSLLSSAGLQLLCQCNARRHLCDDAFWRANKIWPA